MDGRVLAGNIIHNTEDVRRGGKLSFRSFIQPRQTRAVRYCTSIVGTPYSGDTMGWMDYGKREESYGCCYARTGLLWIYPGPWVRALLMLMPMLTMMMMMMVVDTYPRRGQLFWETRDLPYSMSQVNVVCAGAISTTTTAVVRKYTMYFWKIKDWIPASD